MRSASGFTLLELAIATSVLLIGFGALVSTLVASSPLGATNREEQLALEAARRVGGAAPTTCRVPRVRASLGTSVCRCVMTSGQGVPCRQRQPRLVRKILTHLQLPTDPPPLAPARAPPESEFAW